MRRRAGKVQPVEKVWLSSREAKAYLDIKDDKLRSLRDSASISFTRIGSMYWHDKRSIDRLLEKNRVV